jgi:hypothetical protein
MTLASKRTCKSQEMVVMQVEMATATVSLQQEMGVVSSYQERRRQPWGPRRRTESKDVELHRESWVENARALSRE